jgi:hypothetical protein
MEIQEDEPDTLFHGAVERRLGAGGPAQDAHPLIARTAPGPEYKIVEEPGIAFSGTGRDSYGCIEATAARSISPFNQREV